MNLGFFSSPFLEALPAIPEKNPLARLRAEPVDITLKASPGPAPFLADETSRKDWYDDSSAWPDASMSPKPEAEWTW